ncbi:PDR/VanB family oxidoreductase [Oceanobacter antarcticus]|uniref:PDR/VanB family oxidoreductase n=1 Tax=Oceanobacter antarcticus TaxID=3133425 RepID=A0ABW8NNB0_9GAMM
MIETIEVVILNKYPAANAICGLDLALENGADLPAFSAGAHIDLHLPSGLVRQYSLLNAGSDCHQYQIAVLRDPHSRGGSVEVHEVLQAGQRVQISAPRNLFPLQSGVRHSVLIAGGIGVTPILSMARELNASGSDFEVHYAARSRATAAFGDQFQQAPLAAHSHCYFDDDNQRLDIARIITSAPASAHLYVCGPGGFIDYVLDGARQQGWDESRLHREFFAAPVHHLDSAADSPFELVIKSSGQIITVAANQSAFEALDDAGIDIPVSCEQGICGSCLTAVVHGIPDHRDNFLTDDEKSANNQFTPCCSRAKGKRLVLGL